MSRLNKIICQKCYKKFNWNWGFLINSRWEHGNLLCPIKKCSFDLEHIVSDELKEINNYPPKGPKHYSQNDQITYSDMMRNVEYFLKVPKS